MQKYPEPIVGGLVLDGKGKVLLCKSPKFKNKYIVPGGHIEVGETFEQALKRELKEETGLDVNTLGLLEVHEAINPVDFFEKRHFIFFDFLCGVKDQGKIRLDNEELTEFLWISPEKALEELDLEI